MIDGEKASTARLAVLAGLVAAGAGAAVAWSGLADSTRSEGQEAACGPAGPVAAGCDTTGLSRSIAYLDERYRDDPWNHLVAGRLVDRHMLRFRRDARLEDVRRAEEVARAVVDRLTGPAGRGGPGAGSVRRGSGDEATRLVGTGDGPSWERVRAEPAVPRARLSGVLLAEHRFRPALRQARRAVRADSSEGAAWAALFDAAVAGGRYDVAEEALSSLPRGDGIGLLREARWLAAHGELRSARRRISRLCQRLSGMSTRDLVAAWCLTVRADVEHQLHGPDAAEAVFERALQVEPGYRAAVEGLAWLAYASGEWSGAAALYGRIAADAHPDIYLRLAEIGEVRGREGAVRRHLRSFERALARADSTGLDPDRLYAHSMATYQLRWGDPREALTLVRRDVRRRPAVESWDLLAWVRHRLGRHEAALAASDSAYRWAEPSATAQFHRAQILRALDRRERADRLEREALSQRSRLAPHVLYRLAEGPPRGRSAERRVAAER